jgi:hypothetical protein
LKICYGELTSPETQKFLVKSCAEVIAQTIVDEIGDSYFTLVVDEPHDKVMLEKISIIVRFVNKHGQVIERLLGTEYTTLDTALSMKEALYGLLTRHGLSISRLRGVGCNLVSNMTVEFDELKSLILKENPDAHYVHCFPNQFQLVIVSVARSIRAIGDFFFYVDKIVETVGASCGTNDALIQKHYARIVEKMERGVTSPGKGNNPESDLAAWPAQTKWGSYCKTLLQLITTWLGVLKALEDAHDDRIRRVQSGAAFDLINDNAEFWPPPADLIERMETFEFVFILHLMVQVLSWTGDLSFLLEQEGKNIVKAMDLIEPVKDVLRNMQENQWDELFEEVKNFCVAMSIPVPRMDDNLPVRGYPLSMRRFVKCYHHYHVEIFTALIDSITTDINSRFSKTSVEILRCTACLDPSDSFSKFNHGLLLRVVGTYSHDFSTIDREIIKEQLHVFIRHVGSTSEFSSCCDLGTLAMMMLKNEAHLTFPLVYRLIELLLILPVATATTERAFSARNLEFCKEISNEWCSDMMVCNVEKELFKGIGDENILHYFESTRSQRIHPS